MPGRARIASSATKLSWHCGTIGWLARLPVSPRTVSLNVCDGPAKSEQSYTFSAALCAARSAAGACCACASVAGSGTGATTGSAPTGALAILPPRSQVSNKSFALELLLLPLDSLPFAFPHGLAFGRFFLLKYKW